jgi:hypothetical protein
VPSLPALLSAADTEAVLEELDKPAEPSDVLLPDAVSDELPVKGEPEVGCEVAEAADWEVVASASPPKYCTTN